MSIMRLNLTVALVTPLAVKHSSASGIIEPASGAPSQRFALDAPAGYPRR